jgi:hypothetical protein
MLELPSLAKVTPALSPIARSQTHRKRMAVIDGGRPARTHFRRLERWLAADLLREASDPQALFAVAAARRAQFEAAAREEQADTRRATAGSPRP